MGWATFWAIFLTSSSGHPDRRVEKEVLQPDLNKLNAKSFDADLCIG
jgi:hypothetical protein